MVLVEDSGKQQKGGGGGGGLGKTIKMWLWRLWWWFSWCKKNEKKEGAAKKLNCGEEEGN